LYVVLALATVGWYPLSDLTRVCPCASNTDPPTYMWALAWWPYALVHGLNPLVSHYVWSPGGANLAHSATIPTAAFAMSPVTALFGPFVSYNVLMIASPALAAFTAYLLCRRLVRRELPALAAGFLFGFGPYEFSQLVAHANISLIFLIPVFVHVALRRFDGEISRRAYIAAMAALFVAQLGLSSEMLATGVVIGAVVIIGAGFLAPASSRPAVSRLLLETACAGLLALLVASPFVYYALIKGGSPQEWPLADAYGLDVLNPIFPTQVSWLGNETFRALSQTFNGANLAEADGYISLPIIIAFGIWAARTRRGLLARLLLLAIVASLLVALGAHIHVAGFQTLTMPFNWVKSWPVFRLLTPSRIVVYPVLAIAIGIAAWLAAPEIISTRRKRGRWLVFGLGALMIFPNVASGLWGGSPSNPRFFRSGLYHKYVRRGENVIALPYGWWGNSMLWQAETNFYFRMPEGYLGHFAPAGFEGNPVVGELYDPSKPVNLGRLAQFVATHHVGAILIDASQLLSMQAFTTELADLGLHPVSAGGISVYRLPPGGL
jgi:hypothetical protein